MAKDSVKKIGKTMEKAKAKKWVKDYQKANPKAAVKGWLYGKDILEKLCQYPDSEGIWFFKGLSDEGEERLVMFPADAEGNILDKSMKSLGAAARGGGDDPANSSQMCPPTCPNGL
jgi:hypothetical protein